MDSPSADVATGAAPDLDVGALGAWLAQRLDGFHGPLRAQRFEGGQSNPTYLLQQAGGQCHVLRSKPAPAARLLPSAHAIEREFAVMRALAGSEVPVPRMLLLCEDESVIGRAFYLMDHVAGRVFWNQALPELPRGERAALYDEMNRVIAALHRVDYAARGLAGYGRPGNYFERQIGRWTRQYRASSGSDGAAPIEAMERLIDWLPAHLPAGARDDTQTAIVHGDYRLDNLVFHPSEPRILAVLDWELSTLGHPLADFSYQVMGWHIPPAVFRGLGGLDLAALGIPGERDYVAAYCRRTDRAPESLEADWSFYLAYNLFRMAGILQGIAKRVIDGTAASARAREAAAAARPLAELGWTLARRG